MSALDTSFLSQDFSGGSQDFTNFDTTAVAPTVPTEVATAPDQLPYLTDTTAASEPDTTATQSDSGGFLSGLNDIFSTAGNIFSTVYRTTNPTPAPKGVVPPPGYYWNGQTGAFVKAPGVVGTPNAMILVMVAIVVVVLLTNRK